VRFEQLRFRYARRGPWTLHDVDATVHPGETVVVLGRNGAGKSTLLQLAAGVLRPAGGRLTDRPAVVGWVPERFPADQPFTARAYLRHMAALRGLRGTAEVDHWLERLLLAEHAGTRLSDLSKGTAQKVGLAQALLVRPGLLVLDEPWEGLDAAARTLIPGIVGEVVGAGGAVLVSDHRGEIAGLPGAVRWTVAGGTVTPTAEEPAEMVIELAVGAAEAADAVARLRADGHRVLGVRAR
jgi:ABC-2 type transport system ATP-binding protein